MPLKSGFRKRAYIPMFDVNDFSLARGFVGDAALL